MYDAYVRTVMLHDSKIWVVLDTEEFRRLERNEVSMFHWMCNVNACKRIITE